MVSRYSKILKKMELNPFPQPHYIHLRYPLLLCHGYGALASLFKPAPLHEVCMLMRRHGISAFAPNVDPYAKIEPRARNWKRLIERILEQTNAQKLNVVAHSMGGLDIRYAISKLGMADSLATLSTLSTPHRGTPLANLALNTPNILRSRIGAFFDWLGDHLYTSGNSNSLDPLHQLTSEYLENTFNRECKNHDSVTYFSYSSAVGKGTSTKIRRLLRFQNRYIFKKEGLNDGFVSVSSALWGEHRCTFELSHLEHMKLGLPENRETLWKESWLEIVRTLSNAGF